MTFLTCLVEENKLILFFHTFGCLLRRGEFFRNLIFKQAIFCEEIMIFKFPKYSPKMRLMASPTNFITSFFFVILFQVCHGFLNLCDLSCFMPHFSYLHSKWFLPLAMFFTSSVLFVMLLISHKRECETNDLLYTIRQ